jgi:hypothetical protein
MGPFARVVLGLRVTKARLRARLGHFVSRISGSPSLPAPMMTTLAF